MDAVIQFLQTKEIGFVRFGEPDFTQLTGLALVFVAIALISIFTIKEAQDQRRLNAEEVNRTEEPVASTFQSEPVAAPVSSPVRVAESTPQVSSPEPTKKPRGRTPSRGRTPKKEAPVDEEEEEERAKTPSKKRATSNRRGRQSEAAENVASPEVVRSSRVRQAKTPKA
eukprot:gene3616-2608_t